MRDLKLKPSARSRNTKAGLPKNYNTFKTRKRELKDEINKSYVFHIKNFKNNIENSQTILVISKLKKKKTVIVSTSAIMTQR